VTRRIALLIVAAALTSVTAPLLAHEEFRIVGEVSSREPTQFVVKTREGKVVSIALNKQTSVTRDKKKVDVADVRVGSTVVVDAYGDNERDLLALDIQLVPRIPAAKSKSKSK
jgi:hypothetical protein